MPAGAPKTHHSSNSEGLIFLVVVVVVICLFGVFFLFFRAAPTAYESSQAWGQIRAAVASLQLRATPDP